MNFSISAANAYRRCPRHFYFKYVQRVEAAEKAPWLAKGLGVDRLLEVLDDHGIEASVAAIPLHFSDPYDALDAEFILRLWEQTYGKQNRLRPQPVGDKGGSQFEFVHTFNGNMVTGLVNVNIRGFLDKVVLIEDDMGVFEGKTTSEPIEPSSHYWDRLALEPQAKGYCWALARTLGRPVNKVIWQVIRKPSKTVYKDFARVNRDGQPIPIEEYGEKLRRLMVDPSPIGKTMIARKKLYISNEEQEIWATEHAQVYTAATDSVRLGEKLEDAGKDSELAFPKNHLGCELYGGCEYHPVCTGKASIHGPKYKLKEHMA